MDMVLKIGKVLWKLFRFSCAILCEIAFAPESPGCGPAVARQRFEEDTLSRGEFNKARNRE